MRFCYRCGISEEEGGPLIDGLCQVCFRRENPILLLEPEKNTELCQNCGSYKKGGVWVDPQNYELPALIFEVAENTLIESLEECLVRVKDFEIVGWEDIEEREPPVGRALVAFRPVDWHVDYFPAIIIYEVRAKARIHELQVEPHDETRRVTVYVRQTVCPRCQRFLAGYYEAILQVRVEGREFTKEEREEITRLVQAKVDEIMKRDRMGFIQDTIEKEEGIDFYMGSTSSARKLAQAIRERFGGTISEAYELVGLDRQTSKEIYRTSVTIRLPKFRKGDVVGDKHGRVYVVERVDGKGLKLRNLEDWSEEHRDWRTVKRDGIDLVEHEERKALLMNLTPKEAQFMDMQTYETFEIERPKMELEEGRVYRLIRVRGRYYVGFMGVSE
ncbi:60S ribosomal export protein NMD3 [Pyrococcus yayanosii]|uniref:Nonsense-mediated mRNA decay protein n=1 Tax=Pyrococcus yayanosii (strain CH1 / JCM 16557) TaxID=529709 RepID=F8AIL5_PYRYC|nr:60S ribosomal export protein NMD3 [Pyrococcus yayanosii]AEH24381.1 nonsense-mediated mRNA decay protein [Pyrococcus yayanosii CH1]